jgi:alkylation response protein AidB-like acyl-CoA dehydrogenase
LVLFKAEHKRLLEIFHPALHAEYSELLSALGKFLDKKVAPISAKVDSHEAKIGTIRRELLDNGICQIPYPTHYGGLGLPFSIYTTAIELTGAADASLALSVAIHNTVAEGLQNFGSEKQKQRYLPDIVSGRKLGAFGLTEPTSGSDSKSMKTKAKKSGNQYIINGSKMFITNAGEADVYFVFAATDAGPSSFIVEKSAPGLSFGEDLPKLGMRGSRTAEVRFVDCRVPAENLVGDEGKGFEYAKAMLNASRIVMGALCVGIAQAAFEQTLQYSKQRKAFGQSISDFELIRGKIADMKTDINAGRLLCYYASRLKELGTDYSSESSQAKVFSTEMSLRVCDSAIQVFGGYGYTSDEIHRHWRDARLLTIGEGTSEVLRMLIARRELARAL